MPAKTLSLFSLSEMFPDEASAVRFVESQLWGDAPICPFCGGKESTPRPKRHGHHCKSCRKDFTVRIGTVYQCSRLPLRKWLFAAYLMETARKGISSLQLSKELDITQKSAWFLMHRLRRSCSPSPVPLDGLVEIDETFIGGLERNKHEGKKLKAGRGAVGKSAVLGMRERGGRTLAMPIAEVDAETLRGKIREHVAPGSVIFTDEHKGYAALDGEAYMHLPVNHSAKEFVRKMAHTNGIESVWAVLKRGYKGVYHNWSMKHLGLYVDEFAFRLNQGNCEVDTIDRIAALVSGAAGKRLTWDELTKPRDAD